MPKNHIKEVNAECEITYIDGTCEPCPHRPHYTFVECEPGYGAHGECPKWNYYHYLNLPLTPDELYLEVKKRQKKVV
jgi:hypothetical protein